MAKNKCAYCGQTRMTTQDHVPGKAFFPDPKPDDLIKVPACKSCHDAIKNDEDYARQIMVMSPAAESGAGRSLWDTKARRSIRKDKGLRGAIFKRIEPVALITPAGLYLGKAMAMRVDWNRVNRFIEKCVRGLFSFEFREPLPREALVARQYVDERNELLKDFIARTSHGQRRWPGVFDYRLARDNDDKYSSLWAIRFYGGMAFVAYTETSRENPDRSAT